MENSECVIFSPRVYSFRISRECLRNMNESKYVYCVITLMNNIKLFPNNRVVVRNVRKRHESTPQLTYEVAQVIRTSRICMRRLAWVGNWMSRWGCEGCKNDKWKTCRFYSIIKLRAHVNEFRLLLTHKGNKFIADIIQNRGHETIKKF